MGKLLNLIEAAGFMLEYHFDDLVFIDNTSLLFRFDLEDYETVYLLLTMNAMLWQKRT